MSTGFRGFPQIPRGRGFSLLGFYTLFKCFSMFRLVEALNGRLISPKTWDRSVIIFGISLGNLGTVTDCYGFMCDELCYNSCIDVYEAGNDREIRVHKVNR